jgi:hypothetical protein
LIIGDWVVEFNSKMNFGGEESVDNSWNQKIKRGMREGIMQDCGISCGDTDNWI